MATSDVLAGIKEVELDSDGDYKYILIEVTDTASKEKKLIVRAYRHCYYHIEILEEFQEKHKSLKIKSKCLGGGRVDCKFDQQSIQIYDQSVQFGPADQKIVKEILQKEYPNFTFRVLELR